MPEISAPIFVVTGVTVILFSDVLMDVAPRIRVDLEFSSSNMSRKKLAERPKEHAR
jgi:hypothetical protein